MNGILGDVSQVSGTAAGATEAVSAGVQKVAAGAATAGARLASALTGSKAPKKALSEAKGEESAPEPEETVEPAHASGYVTYPGVQEKAETAEDSENK